MLPRAPWAPDSLDPFPLARLYILVGVALCSTLVFIPFGLQTFRVA